MTYEAMAKSRELAKVVSALRKNYELWNYREVFLPAIAEYKGKLDKGTKFAGNDEFYLIKPDITSQILTQLKHVETHKFFYFSEVLDGGVKGSWQFGVEYIGGEQTWMIVEVLTSIITALEKLGVYDFYVDIGSRRIWRQVTSQAPDKEDQIFEALYHRNFELIDELELPEKKKEEVWELFNYRGQNPDDERLSEILSAVGDSRFFADFGTVRHRPYYYDITFEIYSPQVGEPIGGGGEYMYKDRTSCGFAFNVENLLAVSLDTDGVARKLVEGDLHESFLTARKLVAEGDYVEVNPCK